MNLKKWGPSKINIRKQKSTHRQFAVYSGDSSAPFSISASDDMASFNVGKRMTMNQVMKQIFVATLFREHAHSSRPLLVGASTGHGACASSCMRSLVSYSVAELLVLFFSQFSAMRYRASSFFRRTHRKSCENPSSICRAKTAGWAITRGTRDTARCATIAFKSRNRLRTRTLMRVCVSCRISRGSRSLAHHRPFTTLVFAFLCAPQKPSC